MSTTLFRCITSAFVLAAGLVLPAGGHAQQSADSATFIIRLGTDTTAIEQWVRVGNRIESTVVSRSPRTTVRRYVATLDSQGLASHFALDGQATAAVVPAAIPSAGGFYAPQALALAYAARMRDTLAAVPMLNGTTAQKLTVRRVGPDAFEVLNAAGAATMRARLSSAGRLLWLETPAGASAERVAWQDIDAARRNFAARDERGQGMGALSSTDTVRTTSAGAAIAVVYGRPAARGRTVFGGLVPFGKVWRTGANDATELLIDRPVRIGDLLLDPGKYALLTVPGPTQWHLIVNGRTGMAGAMQNDATQELGRTAMATRPLSSHTEKFTILVEPVPTGAVLKFRWETTEAFVPIIVQRKQ
ncbi:MAG: DUF2911 domain-containing protein [Longimicrobiales bacterium]